MAGNRREPGVAQKIGQAIEGAIEGVADAAASVVAPPSPLPATRVELLELHREWRRRRAEADLGSSEYRRAAEEIGRIEVEIARLERAMDPPLV
jgi:hypothetical protein